MTSLADAAVVPAQPVGAAGDLPGSARPGSAPPAPAETPAAPNPELPAALAVTSLSPSRAADFRTCPLRYRFRVIDRLPEPRSPAAVRGTVVHAVLERLFDLPAIERTLERALELIEPEWARLVADSPELAALFDTSPGAAREQNQPAVQVDPAGDTAVAEVPHDADQPALLPTGLDVVPALLAKYFALEDPRRLEPAEREQLVSTVLDGGLTLRGYIDRLDASPDGQLRVVDYKTGRTPGEAAEGGALFQLKFYALVLWRTRGRVPAELRLLYLNDGTLLRYTPDERELLAFERLLQALWRAIRRASATGDFRARRGPLCAWCAHQALCPEWGGCPPPMPPPMPFPTDGPSAEGGAGTSFASAASVPPAADTLAPGAPVEPPRAAGTPPAMAPFEP